MWVYGYGSLMWDGWERKYKGRRVEGAVLRGFHRSFNKASTTNWGTPAHCCPTLGLEPAPDDVVVGVAFEFSDGDKAAIVGELAAREGPSFSLETLDVSLPAAGGAVAALVPVNDRRARTYIGRSAVSDRANLALVSRGKKGACSDYVQHVHDHLIELGIADPFVEEFATELRRVNPHSAG